MERYAAEVVLKVLLAVVLVYKKKECAVMDDNRILIEEIVPESVGDNELDLLWENGTVCGVGCSNAGNTCGIWCP